MRSFLSSRIIVSSKSWLVNTPFGSHMRRMNTLRPSYWHQPGSEPLCPLTVGQLVDQSADKYGHREALVSLHQNQRFTFQQLREQSDRLAAGLLQLGLEPGDRLGLWIPNIAEWFIVNFAAARAGLILVNINPANQSAELKYCLNKVGIKALITVDKFKTQRYPELISAIVPEMTSAQPGDIRSDHVPSLKSVIVISEDQFPGSFKYDDVMASGTEEYLQKVRLLQNKIQPDEGCNIYFTSGTTGSPKAALLSHHNSVNNAYYTGKRLGLHLKDHKLCIPLPLFHAFAGTVAVLAGFHFGSTSVVSAAGYNADLAVQAIKKEKCTVVYGTPTMYVDMLSIAEQKRVHVSLDAAVIGGAPCSSHLMEEIYRVLKVDKATCLMGMTETGPVEFHPLLEDSKETRTNTVGCVTDHLEVKVVDTEGKVVPMETPGELMVRGYSIMLGYWGDEEKTAEVMGADRWFRTGDQIVLMEGGYAKIVGRLKEMIIRGGENIFPKEIEDMLQTHPDILEAQVFGVDDARLGEEVCCCLRLTDGSTITPEGVGAYSKGKIAHYKIPRHIHFVKEFPKTASGKIQKYKLKEQMKKKLEEMNNVPEMTVR